MGRPILLLVILSLSFSVFYAATSSFAQQHPTDDESAIRTVLENQAAAWNRGSIEDFMKSYWNDDSLMFIGQTGITYGYKPTLAHYKTSYDSPDKMGKLFFSLLSVKRLSAGHYFVVGRWLLKRKIGDAGGIFSLLFQKIKGRWKIVADHTS